MKAKGNKNGNYEHGGYLSTLYRIWQGIKDRCYNTKGGGYQYIGNKGIKMCDAWKNDFAPFEKWAKKNGYKDSLIIDRIDKVGNYEPKNCRWLTPSEHSSRREKRRTNTSGQIGIGWDEERQAWRARITVRGNVVDIGRFPTRILALMARNIYIDEHKLPHKKGVLKPNKPIK